MQDRIPLYPGRVKLVPVNGQTNTYDMVRADEPTEAGTPLNKASLLSDGTAALCGLGNDAVPDDALRTLGRFHKSLGNEYIWAKRALAPHFEYASSGSGSSSSAENWIISAGAVLIFGDDWAFDADSGEFEIENSIEILIEPTEECAAAFNEAKSNRSFFYTKNTFNGSGSTKYIYADEGTNPVFIKLTSGSVSASGDTVTGRCAYSFTKYTVTETTKVKTIEYVNAASKDAYHPEEPDGFIYEYVGQVGGKAYCEVLSWEGTGTYGSTNPISITFPFTPKIVYFGFSRNETKLNFTSNTSVLPWILPDVLTGEYLPLGSTQYWKKENGGRTLVWYGSNAANQLNTSGYTYYAVAFG